MTRGAPGSDALNVCILHGSKIKQHSTTRINDIGLDGTPVATSKCRDRTRQWGGKTLEKSPRKHPIVFVVMNCIYSKAIDRFGWRENTSIASILVQLMNNKLLLF